MSAARGRKNHIILVTDKDETQDIISLMLESLRRGMTSHKQLKRFTQASLLRRSSGQAALEELQNRTQGSSPDPVLVIIDALVRRVSNEPAPGNGSAATELLQWLETYKRAVPVVIVSRSSVERLDLKVLGRRNVALWGLGPGSTMNPMESFADILMGIGPSDGPHPRRITVEVGRRSARYHIWDGYYEFTTDAVPYKDPHELDGLILALDLFSPYEANREPRKDWQVTLCAYGKVLFRLLIEDPLGAAFLGMIDAVATPRDAPIRQFEIDLRFDVDLAVPETESLFKLPFEAVNHDWQPESFLCATVPMARRISLQRDGAGAKREAIDDPGCPTVSRRLRILALNASVSGSVSVVHEATGAKIASKVLDPLDNTDGEIEALLSLARTPTRRAFDEPEILSGLDVKGHQLRDQLETRLTTGQFDIFHFSGHSITDDQGGTFLVFPGERGQALAVSVRAIAEWIRRGGCRLVVLSSCRGASLRTAVEMMKAGADAVLGFRWDVDDKAAVDYFRRFYTAYLGEGMSMSAAYREACRFAQNTARGTPIWASAVTVVRD